MKADAVVVLGGGLAKDGTLADWTYARLERGLALVDEGVASHLVVSGGWGLGLARPCRTEAEVMMELADQRMNSARIHPDPESRDTVGNAWFTGRIVRRQGWRSLCLVTSDFHVSRAAWVFSRVLPNVLQAWVPVETGLEGTRLHHVLNEEAVIRTFLGEWMGSISAGDDSAFARFIREQHPGYAKDPGLPLNRLNERLDAIREEMRRPDTLNTSHGAH